MKQELMQALRVFFVIASEQACVAMIQLCVASERDLQTVSSNQGFGSCPGDYSWFIAVTDEADGTSTVVMKDIIWTSTLEAWSKESRQPTTLHGFCRKGKGRHDWFLCSSRAQY
jgi:hypothetical protein